MTPLATMGGVRDRERSTWGLFALIALLVAVGGAGFAGRALAATTALDGVIVVGEGTTWPDSSVAVVTLVDMTADPDSGAILGQQRIDAPGAAPVAFEVLYDDARLVVVFGSVVGSPFVDGS